MSGMDGSSPYLQGVSGLFNTIRPRYSRIYETTEILSQVSFLAKLRIQFLEATVLRLLDPTLNCGCYSVPLVGRWA